MARPYHCNANSERNWNPHFLRRPLMQTTLSVSIPCRMWQSGKSCDFPSLPRGSVEWTAKGIRLVSIRRLPPTQNPGSTSKKVTGITGSFRGDRTSHLRARDAGTVASCTWPKTHRSGFLCRSSSQCCSQYPIMLYRGLVDLTLQSTCFHTGRCGFGLTNNGVT